MSVAVRDSSECGYGANAAKWTEVPSSHLDGRCWRMRLSCPQHLHRHRDPRRCSSGLFSAPQLESLWGLAWKWLQWEQRRRTCRTERYGSKGDIHRTCPRHWEPVPEWSRLQHRLTPCLWGSWPHRQKHQSRCWLRWDLLLDWGSWWAASIRRHQWDPRLGRFRTWWSGHKCRNQIGSIRSLRFRSGSR